jgi:hypothetical protein
MWRHSLNTPNVFIVFHYYFNMSSDKGDSETSESELFESEQSELWWRNVYGNSNSSENSDEKKKSNLELLFVDNKWLSLFVVENMTFGRLSVTISIGNSMLSSAIWI